MNIDAAAQYLNSEYDGPRLPQTSALRLIKPVVSRDKSEMVNSVIDTLRNLIRSDNLLKTQVNTEMGFYIGKIAESYIYDEYTKSSFLIH